MPYLPCDCTSITTSTTTVLAAAKQGTGPAALAVAARSVFVRAGTQSPSLTHARLRKNQSPAVPPYRTLRPTYLIKSHTTYLIIASDTHGGINVWDRRVKALPCLEFTSTSCGTLNSIQLNEENQIIFGAGKHGVVYVWDIRGGRASATFQSHKEICHPPLTSLKLATLLEKIGSLKAQADIVPKEIHSIDLNPSCPSQLAFHLDDGWSGVLDINNFQVTHIHCPPPAWLNDSYVPADLSYIRKPSWLSTCSIYLVGSPSDSGIYLLDFYPSISSPSHVDFKEDIQEISRANNQKNQNRFIPLSEGVISCAAHPLYNAIVAGTKQTSLLMISQRHESLGGED